MESIPAVFIERVTGILSRETLYVLDDAQAILGRWALLSIPNLSNSFDLSIGIYNGKKFSRCKSDGRSLDLVDVFPMWNSATCHFKKIKLYALHGPAEGFKPMTEKEFSALKKMIANQRRRIFKIQIYDKGLIDNFVDVLEVCGGSEILYIGTNMTRAAPIVEKLISDGGVCELSLLQAPFPEWLVPTLTTQFGLGNLTSIRLYFGYNDSELCERLIHMAVNHILKQEHENYLLVCPEKYAHLLHPLQSQLKYVSSQSTSFSQYLHYSHPGKNMMVNCRLESYRYFSYRWKRHFC
uniref:NYN domain-containing protein n=1 Tax=Steinernema glaseri TaxID=37863 RepID=A0A1I7YNE6_9BILA